MFSMVPLSPRRRATRGAEKREATPRNFPWILMMRSSFAMFADCIQLATPFAARVSGGRFLLWSGRLHRDRLRCGRRGERVDARRESRDLLLLCVRGLAHRVDGRRKRVPLAV